MDGRVESTNRNHVTVNASNELEAAATSVRACATTDKKHVVQFMKQSRQPFQSGSRGIQDGITY